MAGTIDLAAAISYVIDRGGSVRLIGDDQQLAAIGAGGVLRDLAAVHGAVTLSQVVRFTDPVTGAPNHAEGAASLALRDGDPAAIAYYLDNHRVHVGDPSTVADDAYAAWAADRAAGRDALMLAPTRELVAQLNDRARHDRLAAQNRPVGRQVSLADQSQASAGDTVITRANNRRIPITATDWVKNGDRWTVETVHESGALDVVHLRTGRRITLPADYVAAHVSLGYAATVHAAQGITADTCHTVATGDETRQLLYVAMTRGRHANHLHLATAGRRRPPLRHHPRRAAAPDRRRRAGPHARPRRRTGLGNQPDPGHGRARHPAPRGRRPVPARPGHRRRRPTRPRRTRRDRPRRRSVVARPHRSRRLPNAACAPRTARGRRARPGDRSAGRAELVSRSRRRPRHGCRPRLAPEPPRPRRVRSGTAALAPRGPNHSCR